MFLLTAVPRFRILHSDARRMVLAAETPSRALRGFRRGSPGAQLRVDHCQGADRGRRVQGLYMIMHSHHPGSWLVLFRDTSQPLSASLSLSQPLSASLRLYRRLGWIRLSQDYMRTG
jgi:hypothetical protein